MRCIFRYIDANTWFRQNIDFLSFVTYSSGCIFQNLRIFKLCSFIPIFVFDTKSLDIDGITVATLDDSQKAITKLDMALEQISKARATAGAQMNRLEYTITNLNTTRENMVSAESRIRDLDIAQASSDLAAQQVLLQSATAMLAQANQIPSYAAQLLQ